MNKLALTQKTSVLTYQTQYTKIFLEIWATYFVTITLAENPCVANALDIKAIWCFVIFLL